MPSLASEKKTVTKELTHLVYERDPEGRARMYLNGRMVQEKTVAGDLSDWKGDYHLALGDELTGGRPWLGRYHRVAIFSRSLGADDVAARFAAGPRGTPAAPSQPKTDLFVEKIAPLLANHCLECHDASTREGKLDLSRKHMALAAKDVLVAGKASASGLWKEVESDSMPEDRDPLSAEDKALLREWIDSGAEWTLATIDPADYQRPEAPGLWVRRLTQWEFLETVRGAVGVDISEAALELLPPDLRADGFSNTAYNLNIDLKHVEAYAELASRVVGEMDVAAFATRFSKKRNVNDKDMFELLEAMGKWLLRGPMAEDEWAVYRGITTTVVTAGGDFDEAVAHVVEAMLQSPKFLYRMERQVGDGRSRLVSDHEMASRLSYALWGGPPDAELYNVATEGELNAENAIRGQVNRMLKDPRAITQSERWLGEWLDLDRLEQMQPSEAHFPGWHADLAADMQAETEAFFREIVWEQKRPLGDLMNAQLTFVTPRLAKHYGLPVPETGGAAMELIRVNLEEVPSRGGLLTQGSVLTMGGEEASMVTRGLFVFRDLLRGTVRNPPPSLQVSPVPPKAGLTHRDVAEQRVANSNCGSCHSKFEPLAYGLEKFDGLGSFMESDRFGNALREDGEVLIPGMEEPVKYESAAALMDLLAKSDRVRESLTWKLTQFVMGRPLVSSDVPTLKSIHANATGMGGTYAAAMEAILTSDLVRKTGTLPSD